MEAINHDSFDAIERSIFLERLSRASKLRCDAPEINDARTRLMTSFRKSSGYELQQVASQLFLGGRGSESTKAESTSKVGAGDSDGSSVDSSPVCVVKRSRYS